MSDIEKMKLAYEKHKNLKLAAKELNINFHTLYWNLKKNGVSVSGDKERYGSEKDRFGVHAEKLFSQIVPYAVDMNSKKFQAKCDFDVNGILVEVKAAKRQMLGVGNGGDRWSFNIKRQITECDFYVFFAFSVEKILEKIFLIPADVICGKTTVSISANGTSKWHPYEVSSDDLLNIFDSIKNV